MNNFIRHRVGKYLITMSVIILPKIAFSKSINYYQLSEEDPSICLKFKATCSKDGELKSTLYKRTFGPDKCHWLSGSQIRYKNPYAEKNTPVHKRSKDKQEIKRYVCKKKSYSSDSTFNSRFSGSNPKSNSWAFIIVEGVFEVLIEGLTGGFLSD